MILDTNAVSGLFAGDPGLAKRLAVSERHHLPIIVIGEYRYDLLHSSDRRVLEPLLEQLENESFILYPDRTTTIHYAAVRQRLKLAGTPIPENDVWIAAVAARHGVNVLTYDQHFRAIRRVGSVILTLPEGT